MGNRKGNIKNARAKWPAITSSGQNNRRRKILHKKENREKLIRQLRDKEPPEQLNRVSYRSFKDAENLSLRYETEEDVKDKLEIVREHKCRTCHGKWENKAQLTPPGEE